jgi:DNA-binding NarL/FixJ family response regulator
MIRVLIVDDQVVVTQGLRVILNAAPTVEVVGTAYETVEMAGKLTPDLVLMDLKMPGMNGIHATRAGAAGYLLKDSSGEEIIAAIEGTVEGETHIDPAVADTLMTLVRQHVEPDRSIAAEPTERELVVLQLVARGLTNADIAEKLFLAEGISTILDKLGVDDRTRAAALAWHHGLVHRGTTNFKQDDA